MSTHLIITIIIFLVSMTLIMTEKINRSLAALGGGVLMVICNIMPEEVAFDYIDLNTIGVLIGMMISVSVVKNTGLFEYIAIKSAKIAKADPWRIILSFSIITAITSALLDNVTTVLLIAPMTLVITETLELNPIPFLIPEILASNIGGTSTLIGDPPNIMVGSAAGLGFEDFLVNLLPVCIVIFIITFVILKIMYKKQLVVKEKLKQKIMGFDENKSITDRKFAIKSVIVLFLIMIGFFLHESLGYPSSVIALAGAVIMVLVTKSDIEEAFKSVEWTVIFFFIGLFIIVGGLEEEGIMEVLAQEMIKITHGDTVLTTMVLVWVSAIASAFLDNIPFVATMIPMLKAIGQAGHQGIEVFWWALALGACLGGNGTLIGASANIIVAGTAQKHGYDLSFKRYFKVGFPMMIVSIIIASVYLLVRYI